jgi:hypothetical protein
MGSWICFHIELSAFGLVMLAFDDPRLSRVVISRVRLSGQVVNLVWD